MDGMSECYRYGHYDPIPSKVADVSDVPLGELVVLPDGPDFNSAI